MGKKLFIIFIFLYSISISFRGNAFTSTSIVIVSKGIDSLSANENSLTSVHALSANGRYITFVSDANNLVPNDMNGRKDLFVFDKATSSIELASVATNGSQANEGVIGGSDCQLSISSDGRDIAFVSASTNLVSNDTNNQKDVFVRDLIAKTTSRVSVASNGSEATLGAYEAYISANGRFVAFTTSSVLSNDDIDGNKSVYIHDRDTSITEYLPIGGAYCPVISSDGRYVAFLAKGQLVPEITNPNIVNVFVYDRIDEVLTYLSKKYYGSQASDDSYPPTISEDGRFIAFVSKEQNITPTPGGWGSDTYLFDQQTNEMLLVDSDYYSYNPMLSPNGKFLIFISSNDNIDDLGFFVYNIANKSLEIITLNERDTGKSRASISNDGAFISFYTSTDNLVAEDKNGYLDVFLLDRSSQIYTNHISLPLVLH